MYQLERDDGTGSNTNIINKVPSPSKMSLTVQQLVCRYYSLFYIFLPYLSYFIF